MRRRGGGGAGGGGNNRAGGGGAGNGGVGQTRPQQHEKPPTDKSDVVTKLKQKDYFPSFNVSPTQVT